MHMTGETNALRQMAPLFRTATQWCAVDMGKAKRCRLRDAILSRPGVVVGVAASEQDTALDNNINNNINNVSNYCKQWVYRHSSLPFFGSCQLQLYQLEQQMASKQTREDENFCSAVSRLSVYTAPISHAKSSQPSKRKFETAFQRCGFRLVCCGSASADVWVRQGHKT
jgi:hypothetical protein